MAETTVVCPKCGAHNAATAQWCTQCYERLDPGSADTEHPGEEERRFAHPDSTINYPGRPIYSRSSRGISSFGRKGRIVATAIVLGIAVALLLAFNYLPAPALVWAFIVTPLLLREFWKKTPAGYEKDGRAEPEPDRPA